MPAMLLLLGLAIGPAAAQGASDDPPLQPLTIARLQLETPEGREVGGPPEDLRQRLLERLGNRGFPVQGLQTGAFSQDAAPARFQLGATLTDVQCVSSIKGVGCELAVEWQLYDTQRRGVVYSTIARGYGEERGKTSLSDDIVWQAMQRSVDSLAERGNFAVALAVGDQPGPAPSAMPDQLVLRQCSRDELSLPDQLDQVAAATVQVVGGEQRGSGVLLSADGFVLTAAHLVVDALAVQVGTADGQQLSATVLVSQPQQDLALLRIAGDDHPCVPLVDDSPRLGEALFAVETAAQPGADPTIARGIASGVHPQDDVQYLQTDASLTTGHSGSPLVDASGRLVAMVTWQLPAPGMQGLAFGVPVADAVEQLDLSFGQQSNVPDLQSDGAQVQTVVDPPDPSTLGKRPELKKEPLSPRARSFRAGTILGVTGLAAGLGTWAWYAQDPDIDRTTWTGMQAGNLVGWTAAVTGVGLFTYGLTRPGKKASARASAHGATVTPVVGLGQVGFSVDF